MLETILVGASMVISLFSPSNLPVVGSDIVQDDLSSIPVYKNVNNSTDINIKGQNVYNPNKTGKHPIAEYADFLGEDYQDLNYLNLAVVGNENNSRQDVVDIIKNNKGDIMDTIENDNVWENSGLKVQGLFENPFYNIEDTCYDNYVNSSHFDDYVSQCKTDNNCQGDLNSCESDKDDYEQQCEIDFAGDFGEIQDCKDDRTRDCQSEYNACEQDCEDEARNHFQNECTFNLNDFENHSVIQEYSTYYQDIDELANPIDDNMINQVKDYSLYGNVYDKDIQWNDNQAAYVLPISTLFDGIDWESNSEKKLNFLIKANRKLDLQQEDGNNFIAGVYNKQADKNIPLNIEYNPKYFNVSQKEILGEKDSGSLEKNDFSFYFQSESKNIGIVNIKQIKNNPKKTKKIDSLGAGRNSKIWEYSDGQTDIKEVNQETNEDFYYMGVNQEINFKKMRKDDVEDYSADTISELPTHYLVDYIKSLIDIQDYDVAYAKDTFSSKHYFVLEHIKKQNLLVECDTECKVYKDYIIQPFSMEEQQGEILGETITYNTANSLTIDDKGQELFNFELNRYTIPESSFKLSDSEYKTQKLGFLNETFEKILNEENNGDIAQYINFDNNFVGLGLVGYSDNKAIAHNWDIRNKQQQSISYMSYVGGDVANVYSETNSNNNVSWFESFNDDEAVYNHQEQKLNWEGGMGQTEEELELKIKLLNPNFDTAHSHISVNSDGFLIGSEFQITNITSDTNETGDEIRTYTLEWDGDFDVSQTNALININIEDHDGYNKQISLKRPGLEKQGDICANCGMGFLKENEYAFYTNLTDARENLTFQLGLSQANPVRGLDNFNVSEDIKEKLTNDFLIEGKVNVEFELTSPTGKDLTDKVLIQKNTIKNNSNLKDVDELKALSYQEKVIGGVYKDSLEFHKVNISEYYDNMFNYNISVRDRKEPFTLQVRVNFEDMDYSVGIDPSFGHKRLSMTEDTINSQDFVYEYNYNPQSRDNDNPSNFTMYSPYTDSGELFHFNKPSEDDNTKTVLRGRFDLFMDTSIQQKATNTRMQYGYWGDQDNAGPGYGDGLTKAHYDEYGDVVDNYPIPHPYQYSFYDDSNLQPGSMVLYDGDWGNNYSPGDTYEHRERNYQGRDYDYDYRSSYSCSTRITEETKYRDHYSSTNQAREWLHYDSRITDPCGDTVYNPYRGGSIGTPRVQNKAPNIGKAYSRAETIASSFSLKLPSRFFYDDKANNHYFVPTMKIQDEHGEWYAPEDSDYLNNSETVCWEDENGDTKCNELNYNGLYLSEDNGGINDNDYIEYTNDFDSQEDLSYELTTANELKGEAQFKITLNEKLRGKIESVWIKPADSYYPKIDSSCINDPANQDNPYECVSKELYTKGSNINKQNERNITISADNLGEAMYLDFGEDQLNPQKFNQGIMSFYQTMQVYINVKDCTNGGNDLSCLKDNNDDLQSFLSTGKDDETENQLMSLDMPIEMNGEQTFLESFRMVDEDRGDISLFNPDERKSSTGYSSKTINNFLDYVNAIGDPDNRMTEYFWGLNVARKHYSEYFLGGIETDYQTYTRKRRTRCCGEFSCSTYCSASQSVRNADSELEGQVRPTEGRTYYYHSNPNGVGYDYSYEGGGLWIDYNSYYGNTNIAINTEPNLYYNLLDGKGTYAHQVSNLGNDIQVYGENKRVGEEAENDKVMKALLEGNNEKQIPSLKDYYLKNQNFERVTVKDLKTLAEKLRENNKDPRIIVYESTSTQPVDLELMDSLAQLQKEGKSIEMLGKNIVVFRNPVKEKLLDLDINSNITIDENFSRKLGYYRDSSLDAKEGLPDEYNTTLEWMLDMTNNTLQDIKDAYYDIYTNNRSIFVANNYNISNQVTSLENVMLIAQEGINTDYSSNPLLIQGYAVTPKFDCRRNISSIYYTKLGWEIEGDSNLVVGQNVPDDLFLGQVPSMIFYDNAKSQGCTIIENPNMGYENLQTIELDVGEYVED